MYAFGYGDECCCYMQELGVAAAHAVGKARLGRGTSQTIRRLRIDFGFVLQQQQHGREVVCFIDGPGVRLSIILAL